MRLKPILGVLTILAVAVGACGGSNRGSGSRQGVPGIPGTQGFQVPPLLPDTFNRVDTLTNRNPTIQTPYLSQTKDSLTATTLSSGLVVLIGGTTGGTALTQAEIYDQRSAEFSLTGMMGQARRHHTANLTTAGDIVVIGGIGQAKTPLISAEIWSSSTGTFTVTQQMRSPRVGHTATTAASGEILVIGGFTDTNSEYLTEKVESLNLATKIWTEHTPIQATITNRGTPRTLHTATLIPGPNGIPNDGDDLLVVLGGTVGDPSSKKISAVTNSVSIYYPSETTAVQGSAPTPGAWRNMILSGNTTATAREGAEAHLVGFSQSTSQIMFIGGIGGNSGFAYGPYTSTRSNESIVEDSPAVELTVGILNIDNSTLTGPPGPEGFIDPNQVLPIGEPGLCQPFVGGIGAVSIFSPERLMAIYTGGNTLCTIPPPPYRCAYNRGAMVIELSKDPITDLVTIETPCDCILPSGAIVPIICPSQGQMGDRRSWHAGARLPGPDGILDTFDDTVLVAGGEQSPAGEVVSADEYAFP